MTFYQRLILCILLIKNENEVFRMTFIFCCAPVPDNFLSFFLFLKKMELYVSHYSQEPASVYSITMLMVKKCKAFFLPLLIMNSHISGHYSAFLG